MTVALPSLFKLANMPLTSAFTISSVSILKLQGVHTIPFPSPIVQAKALQLHKKLIEQRGNAGSEEFAASDGWLRRFSRRHSIRQLMLQGEKSYLLTNQQQKIFVAHFKKLWRTTITHLISF